MCWRTSYGMLSVPRTAAKDIHVKKAFVKDGHDYSHRTLRSLFHRTFKWSLGRKYDTYFLDKPKRLIGKRYGCSRYYVWEVCCGFHSAKEIEMKWSQDKERGFLFVGKPMDLKISYSIFHRWLIEEGIVIHNCIIPKGSKYYVNEYGEYVSNKLIVLPNK